MPEVIVETLVPLGPDGAWEAWTRPDRLATWWWPMFPDTVYDLDARPGGRYRFETATGGFGARGDVVVADRPDRLVLTWTWLDHGADDGGPDPVTVTFAPSGAETLVRVVHETAEENRDPYAEGWRDCFARLGTLVG
ncbi:SRPBCC family protein [Cellulosimicrobium sp. SH8]|uniref:SRPBCC family protein n=1 Tax=Cellulosimicrobium sp. SH8 TaxID=2952936 RepID=UPI0021F3742D|nr:SRPBCC family protein [Cellulosimicrobium sp. SH8]